MSRLVLLVTTLVALGLTACSGTGGDRGDADAASDFRGQMMPEPVAKPEFTLTSTDGEAFDFRKETDGYLTLLFFGYTYCPDICPVHMANLGAVIKELPPSLSQRIKVVFVTTDHARDTPQRLRSWLDNFGTDFIGVAGPLDYVNQIQAALYLPPAQLGEADSTGNYLVGHAASVIAFTPDNLNRLRYPFGIRQADWAHDIPKLLEQEWPR